MRSKYLGNFPIAQKLSGYMWKSLATIFQPSNVHSNGYLQSNVLTK